MSSLLTLSPISCTQSQQNSIKLPVKWDTSQHEKALKPYMVMKQGHFCFHLQSLSRSYSNIPPPQPSISLQDKALSLYLVFFKQNRIILSLSKIKKKKLKSTHFCKSQIFLQKKKEKKFTLLLADPPHSAPALCLEVAAQEGVGGEHWPSLNHYFSGAWQYFCFSSFSLLCHLQIQKEK